MEQQKKNIDEFRMTKQKFRETRKHDAFRSDPLKHLEKSQVRPEDEDIDAIIRELEEKRTKSHKKSVEVKPFRNLGKNSREKFYTEI